MPEIKEICQRKSIILPLEGARLTDQERALYQRFRPFGFILFARNCLNSMQVKDLTQEVRDLCGQDIAIFIDQEGGRVERLKNSVDETWSHFPATRTLGQIYDLDSQKGVRAAYLMGCLQGKMLKDHGINVNCAPVCDVPIHGAHNVIGDRAFHDNQKIVGELTASYAQGLMSMGVMPVIKHLPGHGQAKLDSHKELPTLDVDPEAYKERDLVPFKGNVNLPFAMTAHIRYTAYDQENPATLSQRIIQTLIRGEIGFKGILLSDAIEMGALKHFASSLSKIALLSHEAGCDLPLYCNGPISESEKMLETMPNVSERVAQIWLDCLAKNVELDVTGFQKEFDGLMTLVTVKTQIQQDPTNICGV